MNDSQSTTSYPEQILALLNPPIVIPIDERDDILHTDLWPQCKDDSCPCREPEPELFQAPFTRCGCKRCRYVRRVLARWSAWNNSTQERNYP